MTLSDVLSYIELFKSNEFYLEHKDSQTYSFIVDVSDGKPLLSLIISHSEHD